MTDIELLKKIRSEFNEVQKRTDIKKQVGWTNAFKEVLISIGNGEGLKVCTKLRNEEKDSKTYCNEWLFDLCWLSEENGLFTGLKLIYECEWSKIDWVILDDFHKLVVGKADFKIMVVQYNREKEFEHIKEICEKSVDKSLYTADTIYILVGSGNGENDNEVKWVELWKNNN